MLRKALTNFIWFSQNANVYKNKPNNLCYTLSTHVKLIWKKSNLIQKNCILKNETIGNKVIGKCQLVTGWHFYMLTGFLRSY